MNEVRKSIVGISTIVFLVLYACSDGRRVTGRPSASDLVFPTLSRTWDEGVPLGNGTIGALVWNNDGQLRMSLDRTDLWDLRPTDSIAGDNYSFEWVEEHIRSGNYLPVQQKFDHPYDREPAPAKIPGAALQFPLDSLGEPSAVRLYLADALCEADWSNGTRMQTFVHATQPVGWFRFENLPDQIEPDIIPPIYQSPSHDTAVVHSGADLERLGYSQGTVIREPGMIHYRQEGYGGFAYDVCVRWKRDGNTLTGVWSVTSSLGSDDACQLTAQAQERGIERDFASHLEFWDKYNAASAVQLPDSVLQKQYDNEMYKFGSLARSNGYPISLQGVWTADNGKLPPWKGDYHHDLNTQLSYWPAYTGNHLDEGSGYLNTLWNQRDTYKRYTRQYFGTDGMNVPGVCTLTGEPMGGWIQYAMSQTVGAWLAQHFYLHWKYSADRDFLAGRAYPFVKDVAVYMEQNSMVDSAGVRRLEFSSSPEMFDNSINAWFTDMTNFDLSLMHFIFGAAAEMAAELQLADEAAHWTGIAEQLPEFDTDDDGALTLAKGYPYAASHRHLSHALAIHPLGIIDWGNGPQDQAVIKATLDKIKGYGPDWWTGYTYSWYANMQARAFNGNEAAEALRTFAECFCLPNTFHVNGDQSGTGKSQFTYRPFTLEGNFAFASAIQEMLIQSHTGVVRLFPAIPDHWSDVGFNSLRTMGGFLVSAQRTGGKVSHVEVYSDHGGQITLAFDGREITADVPAGKWVTVI